VIQLLAAGPEKKPALSDCLTVDVHDEYAWRTASRSDGRTNDRDGPSVATVPLGHRSGGVQRVPASVLSADHASHGGGRRSVWKSGYHGERTNQVSAVGSHCVCCSNSSTGSK